jgi:hypothetical protein
MAAARSVGWVLSWLSDGRHPTRLSFWGADPAAGKNPSQGKKHPTNPERDLKYCRAYQALGRRPPGPGGKRVGFPRQPVRVCWTNSQQCPEMKMRSPENIWTTSPSPGNSSSPQSANLATLNFTSQQILQDLHTAGAKPETSNRVNCRSNEKETRLVGFGALHTDQELESMGSHQFLLSKHMWPSISITVVSNNVDEATVSEQENDLHALISNLFPNPPAGFSKKLNEQPRKTRATTAK